MYKNGIENEIRGVRMIAYAILNVLDNICCIEGKGTYAIYFTRTIAEEYANALSEALNSEFKAKKVNIEVLE